MCRTIEYTEFKRTMKCPKCQTDNRESAKYCDECGYELPTVAPIAHEMFSGEINIDDISSAETVNLSGLDQMLDSSNASMDSDMTIKLDTSSHVPIDTNDAQSLTVNLSEGANDSLSIPLLNYASQGDAQSYIAYEDPLENPKKKGYAKKVLIIVISALAVILAALGITYAAQLWGGKAVPDVVGYSLSDAEEVLKESGFNVVVEKVVSDDVEGIVLSTNPEYGMRALEGSDITVGVSAARLVPDVVGRTQDEAVALMSENGFTNLEFKTEKSNETPHTVLYVTPEIGTRANASALITIMLAEPYTVPDIANKSRDEAVQILQNEGYQVNIIQQRDDAKDDGTAIGTDPAAGSVLNSGSSITLIVSHNRAQELESMTRAFFDNSPVFTYNGETYELDKVDSVSANGDNVSYAVTARPIQTVVWFGNETETRYGNYGVLQGIISWSADNQITATNPSVKQGA